ncbi:MAG TPA: hypothetical protein V6D23_18485 [Candidatus Obscuribacterales bacterium]
MKKPLLFGFLSCCLVFMGINPVMAVDFHQVSGTAPDLETLNSYRDLNFPASEFTADGTMSVVQPNDGFGAILSEDGKAAFVQTWTIAPAGGEAGVMAHINKFDTATGKKVLDIPIEKRLPNNALIKHFATQQVKPIESDALASAGNYLVAMVLGGYQPKRWIPVVFDARNGKVVKFLPKITEVDKSFVAVFQITPDGRSLMFHCNAEGGCKNDLYVFDVPSGKLRWAGKYTSYLQPAGLEDLPFNHFFPLPNNQLASFAKIMGGDERSGGRVTVLDLMTGKLSAVLGEGLEFDTNFQRVSMITPDGQLAVIPSREVGDESNDSRCAGGDPCHRLLKFPEMDWMSRFKLHTDGHHAVMEYFGTPSMAFALNPADPRLLVVGSNSYASPRTDYAMLLDTTNTDGDIVEWYKLPTKGDRWLKTASAADGGYWVLGEQPKGTGLRLVRIPPA